MRARSGVQVDEDAPVQLAEPENEFLRSLEKLQRTRKDPLGSVEGRTGARSAGRAESEGGEGGEEGVSVEGGTASIAARRPTRRAAASAKTALAAARDGARTEPASPDISGAEGGAIKVRMGGVVGAAWGRPRHPHTGRTPPPPHPALSRLRIGAGAGTAHYEREPGGLLSEPAVARHEANHSQQGALPARRAGWRGMALRGLRPGASAR